MVDVKNEKDFLTMVFNFAKRYEWNNFEEDIIDRCLLGIEKESIDIGHCLEFIDENLLEKIYNSKIIQKIDKKPI